MNSRQPMVIVSGLVDPMHIERVCVDSDPGESKVLLACAGRREGYPGGVSCSDLTGYADDEACAHACRTWPIPGDIVLVRDHQLEHRALIDAIRKSNLGCVVLNTDVSYDTDPSWVVSRLRWAESLISVECFALDLFCDVEDSWNVLRHAGGDEFGLLDLQQLCAQFPVVLSADIKQENLSEIAAFPGARGVLLSCDELNPVLPPERHTLPFDAVVQFLSLLLERGRSRTE
ncbi:MULTISPECIES: hypothetical protein [Sorangium]|uniref:hypothetical protein n=1 Tax=Sorangium TaxID=39643 RepID=UPI003D9C1DB4